MPLYFAYGSNLAEGELARFAAARDLPMGQCTFRGVAHLPDHELSFGYESKSRGGGALDVQPRPGAIVPGALYEVDQRSLALLDTKENVRSGRYVPFDATVLTADGELAQAISYRVADAFRIHHHVDPTPEYIEVVSRGYAERGLEVSIFERAIHDEHGETMPLFAYGTLLDPAVRRHHFPHAIAAHVGTSRGRLVNLGAYPGLVLPEDLGPDERVHGELFVHPELDGFLPRLDAYEDFLGWGQVLDSLYRRTLAEVDTADGAVLAWTYLYLGGDGIPIASGRWADR